MAKSKLTADEAREYSSSLAKAAAGDYELMDFAINTLGVPQALGLEAGQWIESIGGYVRRSVEDRREAVAELVAEGRSGVQIATILGISQGTVKNDKQMIEAAAALSGDASPSQGQITTKSGDAAPSAQDIRTMLNEGHKPAEVAVSLGVGIRKVQEEQTAMRKEQEAADKTAKRPTSTKPAPLTEGEASAILEGRLATIEGAALNLAAWWLQHGKEALAGSDLAWVDETIAHTGEKVTMILDSVRGVNANADAALAAWTAEAEGRDVS